MVIYIDVIIIENLIMNYIILYATAVISKVKVHICRIFVSSLIGAIYAVLEHMLNIQIYSNIIIKIILSIILVYIALNPQDMKKMWKEIILFYVISFVFAGVATYLIYTIKPQEIIMKNGLYVGSYVLKVIFLGGVIGYILVTIAFKIVKNKISKKDMFCEIRIKIDENEKKVKAMIDTGNMLKEPITGLPVIVVEKNSLYEVIPEEILNNIEKILGGEVYEFSEEIREKYILKLKVIPFSSLGKENGMLLGLKSKEIYIILEGEETKIENVIVGIYNKSLTKRGEYTALVGIEIMNLL